MNDQLDKLVNKVNSEHNVRVELWVQAIDARLERMRRWGGQHEASNLGRDARSSNGEAKSE